jgi:hypothetical protein
MPLSDGSGGLIGRMHFLSFVTRGDATGLNLAGLSACNRTESAGYFSPTHRVGLHTNKFFRPERAI